MDELGSFLTSRRARKAPAQPAGSGTRRVPGLRREEVSQLAGISVEYYVRLEQGRATHPSDQVLHALADALDLDDDERGHLRDLARTPARRPRPIEPVRPELVHLLDGLGPMPGLLINHRLDVLAWNRPATVLFFDFATATDPNLARFCFLQPLSRERFADWPDVARATAGQLRLAAGRHTQDEDLAALLNELTRRSEDFRDLWAGRDVRERTHGAKRFHHPEVGELTLRFENFDLPGSTQRLVLFSAAPATPAREALNLLTGRTAGTLLDL